MGIGLRLRVATELANRLHRTRRMRRLARLTRRLMRLRMRIARRLLGRCIALGSAGALPLPVTRDRLRRWMRGLRHGLVW